METNQFIAFFLALFVGVSLGLVGSGGSILSVPILVYVLHIEPVLATSYSLFIVGSTALFGGFQKAKQQLVDFKKVFLFGIPTVLSVFITRILLVPKIPKTIVINSNFSIFKSMLILIFFAIVMIFAALKMIRPVKDKIDKNDLKLNYYKIFFNGIFIGFIAGLVGAGGGFLIVPALIFLAKTPIKIAIGTSLFIVAIQSLIGFLGDYHNFNVLDWSLLLKFTFCTIIGLLVGNLISKKVSGEKLKVGFGYFVLFIGIFIFFKEVFMS